MATSVINGNLTVQGQLAITGAFTPPNSSIRDAAFSSAPSDRLTAAKVVHQHVIDRPIVQPGTTVTAQTNLAHTAFADGTIVGFNAVVTGALTGDRTVTVDLQKSTAGGAFATVLSAVITFNSSSTVRVASAATISSASYVAGDVFQIVVAIAGTTGTQAAGLMATMTVQENPS